MSQYVDEKYLTDMLTFGESYMDGLWDVDDLEETLFEMSRTRVFQKMMRPRRLRKVAADSINLQNRERSKDVIEGHYDLGNELFEEMIGPTMAYSCGYWRDAQTLDEAQNAKLNLIANKLELEDGMSVLDLGCGFGCFAQWVNENYKDVKVLGVTLSEEQAKIARQHSDVLVCDYRDARGKFDRVISMGLVEHVGYMNYRSYFKTVSRCLEPDGIHVFQFVGHGVSHITFNPWINEYIFPNGQLPSLKQVTEASERLFTVEDVHNFGPDYAKTCRAWWENCERSAYFRSLPERFQRMWKFYLLFSAAGFRNREFQLYQIVQTKRRLDQPKRVT